jgi:hypothetical protein
MDKTTLIATVAAGITSSPPSGWEPRDIPKHPGPKPSRYCLDLDRNIDKFRIVRDAEEMLYESDDLGATQSFLLEHSLDEHWEPMKARFLDYNCWWAAYQDWEFEKAAQTEAAWRVAVAKRVIGRVVL